MKGNRQPDLPDTTELINPDPNREKKYSGIRCKAATGLCEENSARRIQELLDGFANREQRAIEHFCKMAEELYRPSSIETLPAQYDPGRATGSPSMQPMHGTDGKSSLKISFSSDEVVMTFNGAQFADLVDNHWNNLALLAYIAEHEINTERRFDLVAMGIHDVRNALTIALGTSDLLKHTLALQSKFKGNRRDNTEIFENSRIGYAATVAAAKYLDQTTTLMHANKDKIRLSITYVGIDELIKNIEEQFGTKVICHNLTDSHNVAADKTHLERVIGNLIENALKFSKDCSAEPVEIFFIEENGQLVIEVKDRGPGITDDPEILFRPYQRGSASSGVRGHGLGLAYCKLISERHNGTISCRNNNDGEGATFIVRMPLLASPDINS